MRHVETFGHSHSAGISYAVRTDQIHESLDNSVLDNASLALHWMDR